MNSAGFSGWVHSGALGFTRWRADE